MLAHAGRLMALWEGGSALEVNPETLTAGRFVDWSPDLAGLPFSAHPKVEPDGTLWNIGCVLAPRPVLLFYRIDRTGRLVKANIIPLAPLGMVHDFVVTARHLVVLLTPFVIEPDRLASGHVSFLDAHVWRPELATRVLMVDKDTLELERRYELPPGFHFHHGNGWEEADGTVHLGLCQAPDPVFVTEDLRAIMRGELGVSVHASGIPPCRPETRWHRRNRRCGAGHGRVFPHRSAPHGAATSYGLRAHRQRTGLAAPADLLSGPGTRRGRRLVVPAASHSRGACVRPPARSRGRRLAYRRVS